MRLISAQRLGAAVLVTVFLLILWPARAETPSASFNLTSSAFQNGSAIPERYTCSGLNRSPALAWKGAPEATRSFALIVSDPDAPSGTFIHWVLYNIASNVEQLPEAAATSASPGGAEQGLNGRGELGYTGPCPPPGRVHHYHFRLYALDKTVELKPGATADQLETVLKEHVLGVAELVGTFKR